MNPKHVVILNRIAVDHGFTPQMLLARRRDWAFCKPRQMAIYLCRRIAGGSNSELAIVFERHRGAIIHALRTAQNDIDTMPGYATTVDNYIRHFEAVLNQKGTS